MALNVPLNGNAKLERVVRRINENAALNAWWTCSNVNAIDRMKINDHGPVHIKIVCKLALKLLRLLQAGGVPASVVADHGLAPEDAEVIVVLAACLHDIGHIVHRRNHETFSIALALPLLEELLEGIYTGRSKAVMMAEVLHAMYAHETPVEPLTVEAGCLKIADALDMEEGRARIPFSLGDPTIHAVSALAIEKVTVSRGETKPILIEVKMSNSAGIFQLDNLLRPKLQHSGLKDYVEIRAHIEGAEKKIVERYTI